MNQFAEGARPADPIERLIAAQPHFHAWPDGRPANWSVAPEVLRYIASVVKPGMATLETGAGHTTAAFCIAGARHVSVTPDRDQAARIRAWLDAEGIAADLAFLHESSDVALPAGEGVPDRLDFVLVDGAHRFPFAMIDWHYTEGRVPVGGLVAVDDIWMPSVRILYDFLAGEEDWELVREFQVTAVFRRRRKEPNRWDWADQTINRAFHERITAGVLEPAGGRPDPGGDEAAPDGADGAADGAVPLAAQDPPAEDDLRGARIEMRGLALQIRSLERDLRAARREADASQQTLRKTRDELWSIKRSRSYRLSRALHDAVVAPLRRLRRALGGQ